MKNYVYIYIYTKYKVMAEFAGEWYEITDVTLEEQQQRLKVLEAKATKGAAYKKDWVVGDETYAVKLLKMTRQNKAGYSIKQIGGSDKLDKQLLEIKNFWLSDDPEKAAELALTIGKEIIDEIVATAPKESYKDLRKSPK